MAVAFAAGYGALSIGCLAAAFVLGETAFWQPLLAAVPLGLIQLRYDLRRETRALGRELAGPIALGSVAAAIARAGGWEWKPALGLWIVLAARVVASVPLVRQQIKMARGRPASPLPVVAAQVVALAGCGVAAGFGWSPWLALAGLAVFPIATAVAFTTPPVRATIVGIGQVAAGVLVVVLTAVGSSS